MTKPLTFAENQRQQYFIPHHKLCISLAVSVFDEVQRIDKKTGTVKPFLHPLPQTSSDCAIFRKALEQYQVVDPDGTHTLGNGTTIAQYTAMMKDLKVRLRDSPE